MVGSKNVSNRHTMSKLLLAIKALTNGTLIKLWAASPVKFQWQNVTLCQMSNVTCHSPDVKCQMSTVKCQQSNVTVLISKCQLRHDLIL